MNHLAYLKLTRLTNNMAIHRSLTQNLKEQVLNEIEKVY